MHTRMRELRFVTGAILIVLALSPAGRVFAARQSPTLAELAAKEKQRRQALTARAVVITEEDLPRVPAPALPSTAPPAAPKAQTPSVESASSALTNDSKDEAWWRQRIALARDDLRRSEVLADALQTRLNVLATDIASRDDPHQRARLADDRQKAQAELDRLKTVVERQKQKIGDIEEEARRAGVPPGWLR